MFKVNNKDTRTKQRQWRLLSLVLVSILLTLIWQNRKELSHFWRIAKSCENHHLEECSSCRKVEMSLEGNAQKNFLQWILIILQKYNKINFHIVFIVLINLTKTLPSSSRYLFLYCAFSFLELFKYLYSIHHFYSSAAYVRPFKNSCYGAFLRR